MTGVERWASALTAAFSVLCDSHQALHMTALQEAFVRRDRVSALEALESDYEIEQAVDNNHAEALAFAVECGWDIDTAFKDVDGEAINALWYACHRDN